MGFFSYQFMVCNLTIPLLANIGAVVFGKFFLVPLLGLQFLDSHYLSLSQHFSRLIYTDGAIFLVSFILSFLYLWPSYQFLKQKKVVNPHKACRRALNAPLILSLLSAFGWVLGVSCLTLELWRVGPHIISLKQPWEKVFSQILLSRLFATFSSFIVSFYVLEWINRKKFLPQFFPQNKISYLNKVFPLSTKTRFFIYFFVVAFYPLVLSFFGLSRLQKLVPSSIFTAHGFDATFFAILVIGVIFFILGLIITFMMISYYQKPLKALKKASEAIRLGDYQVQVPVVSADEMGYLAESVNFTGQELSRLVAQLKESNLKFRKKGRGTHSRARRRTKQA